MAVKENLKPVVVAKNDEDKEFVINTIMNTARTGTKGAFGDGKIFINDVECAYTISSGIKEGAMEVAA